MSELALKLIREAKETVLPASPQIFHNEMKIENFNNYGGQVNMADHIGKIEFTPAFSKERFTEFTEILIFQKPNLKKYNTSIKKLILMV